MSQRRQKMLRKASRVVKREQRSTIDEALGKIRARRDEKLRKAGEDFRKGLDVLRDGHTSAREEAWRAYEEERATALKHFAHEEQAA